MTTLKQDINVKDLKKLVLTTKKEDKELSQAYAAILKQVESQTIGIKNPELDEKKLILNACKKEMKEQEQSKKAGAPYSDKTLSICTLLFKSMSPKLMTKREIEVAVDALLSENSDLKMGQIMGQMKSQYKDTIDMKILQEVVKIKL